MPPDYHPPVKRSVEIAGHKTSVSLEPLFWDLLREAAVDEKLPLNALIARIDAERIAERIEVRAATGLAGAVRLWLVSRLREQSRIMGDEQPAREGATGLPGPPPDHGDV